MAITISDLRFFQSERMTDEADGGGQMTAVEIAFSSENAIFDDLSDVDRAAGDVSIRKVYAAVTSDAPDKYLDAGVVVFRPPTDPAVSILAFSTFDAYDEREDLRAALESGITRSSRHSGYLWGTHVKGARALSIWQRLDTALPKVGDRLDLQAMASAVPIHSQMVWVTRVTEQVLERYKGDKKYFVRLVTCEMAEPLRYVFEGLEIDQEDPKEQPKTLIHNTRYNHDALALCGVKPLAQARTVGDSTVKVKGGLYAPLIPTALQETALPDTIPNSDMESLEGVAPAAQDTVAFAVSTALIVPNGSLHLWSGCLPGSLVIAIGSSKITDEPTSDLKGELLLNEESIGTINYKRGHCEWNESCPNFGSVQKTITYRHATHIKSSGNSLSLPVSLTNRGFVWVRTLQPIPAVGSTRVSYRSNDQWYVLRDHGKGLLSGQDSSYGSGTIDYDTGTVVITTGAIPDVESEIIYSWSIKTFFKKRAPIALGKILAKGKTVFDSITPGTFNISWSKTGGATMVTLSDLGRIDGKLVTEDPEEDSHGEVNYNTGEWWFKPAYIPPSGTEIFVQYEHGPPLKVTVTNPLPLPNGDIAVELPYTPRTGTVEVAFPVEVADFDYHEYQVVD